MGRFSRWLHTVGPDTGVLIIAIFLGSFWLGQFEWKAPPDFGCPDGGFWEWVRKYAEYPFIPLYGRFMAEVIAPNLLFWAWFTFLAETLLGVSLLFGLLTRLGGLAGTLWSINLLIGLIKVPNETPAADLFLALLNFLFLMHGAHPRLSLDARFVRPWLRRQPRRWWVVALDLAT